jgi:hypothetical protein
VPAFEDLLRGKGPRRPDPEPFEADDTRVVAVGTALWLLALPVLGLLDLLGRDVHGWWYALCACGVALGLVGLRFVAKRKRAVARRR